MPSSEEHSPPVVRVRVWDLPTRLFHWALVLAVVGLVVTGNVGGNWMAWHFRLGYAVAALVLFRLAWGVVGGHWSRFATFVPGPRRLWAYVRGGMPHAVGHNPLGALSVLAMLLVLALQVGSGLVSDDEIANAGPLVPLVDSAWVSLATSYHKGPGKLVLLGLVALHVAAIVFYARVRRKPLVRAMVSGDQLLPGASPPPPSSADGWRQRAVAAVLLAVCAAAVGWLVQLGG